ncbi:hypothetical protein [Nocardia heshunensis]
MIYEERYGFTPKAVLVLLIAAGFTAAAIAIPDMPVLMRIGSLVLFGLSGLLQLATVLSRKVALRADASGITLGGQLLRYRAATKHVPWSEVEAIVLWRQYSASNIPWLGVLRRADAPPLYTPKSESGRAVQSAASALSGAPDRRLLQCAKNISGWKVDLDRLTAALATIAPHVPTADP